MANKVYDYKRMDAFKKAALLLASQTGVNTQIGENKFIKPLKSSWGRNAFVHEFPDFYLAHVEEGLGTKYKITQHFLGKKKSDWWDLSNCTLATIFNDMASCGAMPFSVAMHYAVGSEDWFKDEERYMQYLNGWQQVCLDYDCTWIGGETPTLQGVVKATEVVLSGSAIGIISDKNNLITGDPEWGNAIIFIESSGIHANGLTKCRNLANSLPKGYKTEVSNGITFGEALLAPSIIYLPVIKRCQEKHINIYAAEPITGHGLAKLMRSSKQQTYVINELMPVKPIFSFLQKELKMTDKEAYYNFNMGAGFALFVNVLDAQDVIDICKTLNLFAMEVGYVEKGERRVAVCPLQFEYDSKDLMFS